MTNLQTSLVTAAVCVTLLISAGLLGNAIENQKQPDYSDAGRWSIQQTFSDGWLLLDSATGAICVVPNAKSPDQTGYCSKKPQ
jgi:hypothetical protein